LYSTRYRSIRGAILATAGLLTLAPVAPLLAQEAGTPYSTDLPQYAQLQALENRAIDRQQNGAQDAEGRAQIIAAWQALHEAAQGTLLADGSVHPLAHIAKISIASQLYRQGEIDASLALAEAGIAGGQPYLAAYPAKMAEGAALIGLLLTQKGEPERGFAMVAEIYAGFLHLDPDGQSEGFFTAKSNLEFSLSQAALRIGRTQEAVDYQKASLDTRETALGADHPDTIASYYSYAQTLHRAGRMDEAEAFARTAVDRAIAHVDPSDPTYARAFEMLGIILANSGRPVEATRFLTRALELKREHEGADTLIFGYGIHNLGAILLERQRYEEVQPLFAEAEALMARYQGPASAFPIMALAYNGQASLALGEPVGAVRLLEEARSRLGEDSSDVEALGRIVPDLVRARMLAGDRDAALAAARQFDDAVRASESTDAFEIALATLLRTYAQEAEQTGDPEALVAAARNLIEATRRFVKLEDGAALPVRYLAAIDLVMEIAARQDKPELMLSAMALVSDANLARATGRRVAQLRSGNPDLAAGLRELDDARQMLDRADRVLLLAIAQGQPTDMLRQDLAQAQSASEQIERGLQQRFPQWAAARVLPEPSIADMQARLGDGQAVLAVTPIHYGTYALLITPSGARAIQLSATRKDVVDLANALGSSVRVGSFDEAASRQLGQALFPAEVMAQLGETQSLKIYANGPLASLPFSLLQGWDGADGNDWLLDRFSLSYLPGLSAWETADRTLDAGPLSLVAFAAPSPFTGKSADPLSPGGTPARIADYFSRTAIDVNALAGLPALPGTAQEIRSIAASAPWRSQRLYIGPDASEAAIRQEATASADIVVIATHGIVAGEIEGIAEPALVLSPGDDQGDTGQDDGVLTASEIAQLDMRAEWIILSSCDSAAGMGGGLPAFSGLAQAFRQAGARDLLVSHWKVRDDIAAFVSSQAVLNYRKGMSKTDALREAIRTLRKDSKIEGADSPFAWAPFVLIEG
tara:strand:- start:1892 stop:4858 length:2967 start_codon:yes stop_codon:yes gene_type:complete